MSESLIPTIILIGGGFLTGTMVGYFLKKMIKILMFVAGGTLGFLLYLQQQQIISINIEKVESTSTFIVTTFGSTYDSITQIGDVTFLGIPLVGSLSAGFTIGLIKG